MICKKCSGTESDDYTKKCTIAGCKFKIPRNHTVCLAHSHRRDLCQVCGKRHGATRKGNAEG